MSDHKERHRVTTGLPQGTQDADPVHMAMMYSLIGQCTPVKLRYVRDSYSTRSFVFIVNGSQHSRCYLAIK